MVSFNASSKIFGTEVAKEFKDYWETKLLGDLVTVVPKHCTSWSSFGFTSIILFYFIFWLNYGKGKYIHQAFESWVPR